LDSKLTIQGSEKKNNPISLAEGLRIQEDFFGS
jgi:hypothetical protein